MPGRKNNAPATSATRHKPLQVNTSLKERMVQVLVEIVEDKTAAATARASAAVAVLAHCERETPAAERAPSTMELAAIDREIAAELQRRAAKEQEVTVPQELPPSSRTD